MEAQRNHRENMKNSKKYEGPKIRASTGDIIIFGGTIIAAAIGAAFVAHRGRSRNDNKGRDRRQHDDERGLQSLVHLGKKESSVDSLMENRGKEGLSIEFNGEGESDRGEDGSEGLGDSSTESSNEAVWPAEVIEQEKEIQSGLIKTENQQNKGDDNLGMGIKSILPRIISNFRGDEEFGFHDSVEIPETKYIVTVENPVEVNANVSNVVVNDLSFWSHKQNAPPGHTKHYIEESDIAHVAKNELLDEGEVEKEEISKKNEIKQQLEISETTRDVFASEREKDMGVLENLPSSICFEQRNGQVSIDKSDVTKEEDGDLNSKSQEVTEFHGEDVGERRTEDSEGSRNSLEVPSDRSAYQEDTIEQEKTDNSMLTNEVNDQFDIPRKVDDIDESAKGCTNDNNNPVRESLSNAVEFNMLDDETSEILEESKISHIEVDLVEEGEGGDQSSQIDGVENVEENGGDGIGHLEVETEEGDDISNMEIVVVEEDVNGGDGVVIEVENEARGDSIANIEIEEEKQQKGGDDITDIEEEEEEVGGDQSSHIGGVENEEENGGDGIAHLNVKAEGDDISNMEEVVVEEDVNGGDGVVIEVDNEARGDSIANIEIEEQQQQKGGDDITNIEEEKEEVGGDQSSHVDGVENEEENGGDGIAHLNVEAEEGNDISNVEVEVVEEDENGGNGVVIEVENEARGDSIADIEIAEEQQQKGGDDITNIEEEEEEVGGDQSSHIDGAENEEKGGDGIAHISNIELEAVEEDENGGVGVVIEVENEARGDSIANIETEEEQQQKGGDNIINIEEEEEEVGGDQSSHLNGVENEEENGGDGIAHLNVEAEEGNDISNIELEAVEEDENGGDGVVIEVENEAKGDSIANIEIEEEQQQKGGDDITNIEEEEEEVGGDQSSHLNGVENEEEKGGHEIANLNVEAEEGNDITNIEVEKVEEDESGGDDVVIKGENEARDDNIANIKIEDQRQNGGADITIIEVVEEKDENGEEGIAIEVDNKARADGITHIEVEEQPQNGGVDITHAKVVFKGEVREDGIAHTELEAAKELKDGEEDKKEDEGEGIAHVEDKAADVDEAKEEKGGDANTHVEVVEEQKGKEDIAYTKLEEELVEEVEEEEEKGNYNAHIEVEEEIGDDRRPKGTGGAVEEKVKEEEKEGDDTTHTEVQKEEEEERGEGEQESSSLKSRETELKSPVEEENEMQEPITENTSMEFDGKEVWTAEEGKLEKHSVPIHEMNEDLENPEMIDQMIGMPPAERDENTNEGIQSFLHHNDRNVEVVVGMSVAIQEKDHINLDLETESQNTGNSFEMAIEKDEGKAVANTDHGNIMKECPYSVEISNFSQYENEQDLQEPDASRVVEEEDKSSIEAEIESCKEKDAESEETRIPSMQIVAEAILQTKVSEEEKRLPFIEGEMKLMSEIRKMTADEIEDIDQVKQSEQGNEPKATNKESEMTVPGEEKKMDFLLTGQSKGLFFFVLALALALGLLALAHHGQLHDNHHRLHKIYYQLYQFFFPSVDGPLDEF